MMRTARTLAVASSSAYSCAIDAAADPAVVTVRDAAGGLYFEPTKLEPGVKLAPSQVGELEFLPDGSARMKSPPLPIASYTVTLTLTDGRGRSKTLRVTGLTGMVGLEESP
jgi:hypothetical protein